MNIMPLLGLLVAIGYTVWAFTPERYIYKRPTDKAARRETY